MNKFENKFLTVSGKQRAFIKTKQFKTLWFNTGTLCNLTCKNCFMESSPTMINYLTYHSKNLRTISMKALLKIMGQKKLALLEVNHS